jgi:hypothetical protein
MVKLTKNAAGELYQLLALVSGAYQDEYMPDITISERDSNVYVLDIHSEDEVIMDMFDDAGIEYAPYTNGIEVEFVSQLV